MRVLYPKYLLNSLDFMMRNIFKNWVSILALCTLSVTAFAQNTNKTHQADAENGQKLATTCVACHGSDGNSVVPMYPNIAGQGEPYFIKQVTDIRDGKREALPMAPFVSGLSDNDIADLAAFYGQQKPKPGAADPNLVELGERIYRAGIEEKNIPACLACHGPAGKGIDLAKFPMLAGQHAQYTTDQLNLFSANKRTNDGDTKIMRNIANRMHASEIEAVSSYIQGLR